VAAYRRSLALRPDEPGVLSNCGNALKDLQRLDEAVAMHRAAVAAAPDTSLYIANLGIALRESGALSEALAAFERAVALDPKNAVAAFDAAQVTLMLGDYAKGWPLFESRWQLPEMRRPRLSRPAWDGSAAPDKTVLLWPEQGYGDTILAARFARLVKPLAGRVVLACKPELTRLFQALEGVDAVVRADQTLPDYDVHCPLMGLPRFFAPDPAAVTPPAQLSIPKDSRLKLTPALARAGKALKVGIVWSGSVTFASNHLRSADIERFLRFAEIPGVRLFSLQKGPRARELAESGADAVVTDLAPLLDDFADTAAAIAGLDLVIMTDSSVAHLTGSLGKPIWNLLPYLSYWLYLRDRADTPWYPSMRLFRQPRPGDWDSVFDEAAAALAALAAAPRA
jgi:tetratricopeptide (TPR) repeat protein